MPSIFSSSKDKKTKSEGNPQQSVPDRQVIGATGEKPKKHGKGKANPGLSIQEEEAPLLSQTAQDDLRLQEMGREISDLKEEALAIGRQLGNSKPSLMVAEPRPEEPAVRKFQSHVIVPGSARGRRAFKANVPAHELTEPDATPKTPLLRANALRKTSEHPDDKKDELDARHAAVEAGLTTLKGDVERYAAPLPSDDRLEALRSGAARFETITRDTRLETLKSDITDYRNKLIKDASALSSGCFGFFHKYEINTKNAKIAALGALLECDTLRELKDKATDYAKDSRVMRDWKSHNTRDLVERCTQIELEGNESPAPK